MADAPLTGSPSSIGRRVLTAAVGMVVMGVIGCTNHEGSIVRSATTSVPGAVAASPDGSTAEVVAPSTTPDGAPVPPPCVQLMAALSAMTATTTGAELSADTRAELERVEGLLPTEAAGDFATMATAYQAFNDPAAPPDQRVGSAAFEVAANRMSAYLATNCPPTAAAEDGQAPADGG